AQLAAELAGTFRVYGLEAPGLTEPSATAASLAELADDYTRRIRAAQPHGPYRLGGWSMGGIIAYEITRRLQHARQQARLRTPLAAPFEMNDRTGLTPDQAAGRFAADAARSLGWNHADLPDPDRATADDQLAWLAARLGPGPGPENPADSAVTARLRDR